jgi:hypothetical protein
MTQMDADQVGAARAEAAATAPGQLLMSYPITLPASYDMAIIRERVSTRGHLLDDRRGLVAKAYAIRESGVDRSPVNQYAPFYLWSDASAAAEFLWGGRGFDGIVRDFGRPVVRTWTPVATAAGGCGPSSVTHAELSTWPIGPDMDLLQTARQISDRARERAAQPGVHLALAGIDPVSWQAVEFVTTSGRSAMDGGVRFQVLHVSQPAAGS